METKKSLKAFTSILTKVAGLVFFAFLAISLGVIFGTLFKDWVSGDPLSPVQGLNEPYQEPLTIKLPEQQRPSDTSSSQLHYDDYFPEQKAVSFKVQVGPFQLREEALQVASLLQNEGYPVFVSRGQPCYVQVGAFSNPQNANNLQNELLSKGYAAYIKEE
ncbi:MAG: SPOR domain-containing protein [Firmicutes bacterium]|nr:SPOR domain-containing protein [Bacillota bacterium]